MTSPIHEFIRFPRRLSPLPSFSAAPWNSNPANCAQYEVITMKRQYWAIEGEVTGIRKLYADAVDGFSIIEGFRCERCNKVFFAAEINDFAHECMESVN